MSREGIAGREERCAFSSNGIPSHWCTGNTPRPRDILLPTYSRERLSFEEESEKTVEHPTPNAQH